jgi:2-(1,2-epoxy-1,2-dihydrophenyl)acetyl-CoA isomerase
MSEIVQTRIEDRVATLTLNRPDKLNALNGEMARLALATVVELAENPEVGCVVVTGAGRAFCAGGDVSDMANATKTPTLEQKVDRLRAGQEFCWMLHSIPKITVAAMNGYAMGAGLGIALSCDMRFASTKMKLGTAYAKVGLGGDYGITWQLTRLVGPAKAKELFVLGDILDAQAALSAGLVNRVIEHERLAEDVAELAGRIAHGPQISYRYMKENVNLAVNSDFRSILDREAFTHIRCTDTEDHREGARAFVEKRPPQFRGC